MEKCTTMWFALTGNFSLAIKRDGSHCCSSFFQAEDGIRDLTVTGVQTCALPISFISDGGRAYATHVRENGSEITLDARSEERRVGKSVDLGGRRIIKKKRATRRSCWSSPTSDTCRSAARSRTCS